MPTIEEALQIGWRQHQAGALQNAEHVYRQVLQVAPGNANAWCFLGMACHDQRRYDEAAAAYRQALQIQPNFPIALSNLGNTLKQQGLLAEAEASCWAALKLKPDYSTAYNNLGVTLVAQGRLLEAANAFEKALSLMPNDAVVHANLSAALVRQGKFSEAESSSQRALAINPNYAEAHKNQGIVWLLLGDFERGWKEYEWRWRCPGCSLPPYQQPLWDGSSLEGRTILLHHEQGLGDTIQFIRYARVLKERGARVICKVQRPLLQLMASCPDIDRLVSHDAELPPFDCHVPMLSVPGILQTTFETIPNAVPYLSADQSLVQQWQRRLSAYPGYKVALVWQGSPDFHADAQRSIPLRHFAPLADIQGVRLISVQKGHGAEQIEQLQGAFEVLHFGDELDAAAGPFMDTAAILQSVDLAILSDTSVTHLAGALAVPTWVALSVSPDWRWFLEREDSPWYPTLRLFRQSQLGDWNEVFARLASALRAQLASTSSPVITATTRASEPRQEHLPDGANSTRADEPRAPSLDTTTVLNSGFNCLKRTRHGYLLFNKHDVYIGRSLDLYGEYSEGEVALCRQILRAGDTVVEVGANIGALTVPLARLVGPNGRVYALEPQRLVFQTLCANLALNSLSNVESLLVAAGAEPGEIVVPCLPPDVDANFGGLPLGEHRTGERRPVLPLDALGLQQCRLLKIDVEGMEQQVLQGASQLIRASAPVIYLENDRPARSPALIRSLLDLGYRLYWHLPPLFEEDNYFQNGQNVFGRIVSVNMLGVPKHESLQVGGLREVTSPECRWQDAV